MNIPVFDGEFSNAYYGSAIHRSLQFALRFAKETGVYPELEKLKDSFIKNLDMEKFETAQIREMYCERGKNSLEKYYKQMLETSPNRVFATEYSFNYLPYKTHLVKGFIDRIEKNSDGTFEVYDYKTGESKSKKHITDGGKYENYLNQLRFYKFAFELEHPQSKVTRAGLIFVEEPDNNFYVDLTQDDNRIIQEKLDEAYKGIDELSFNPPNELERDCTFCSYKNLCKLSDM